MPLRLIIEDDEGTTTIVPLDSESVTIGRQQGNTIQLTEKNVSRRHARLFPESAQWVIEDLNSYNGVKVNGQSIEARVTLKEGDVVQIGDYHLALTEDVDKRTLNFDNREAANDGAMAEPLLVSSSTDLPRLSADELAALQSGPHTPQPSPMIMDSGPVPATVATGYGEERRSGGAGALIGAAVVVVLAVAGGLVWMAGAGNSEPDKPVAGDAAAKGQQQIAAAPVNDNPQGANGAMPIDAEPVDAEPIDAEPVDAEPENTTAEVEPEQPENPVVEPVDPSAGEVEVQPDPEPRNKPDRNTSKPRRNKKPRNDPPPDPTPDPTPSPPEPAVDADALLSQARKAMFKSPREAYDLARKSYQAKRNPDAMAVMALAACRMGDAGKAKRAISKLRGKDKDTAIDSCSRQGIEI